MALSVFGLPPVAVMGVIAVVASVAMYGIGYWNAMSKQIDVGLEELDLESGDGFEMNTGASGDSTGIIGRHLAEKEKQKALGDGMVRWHVAGSAFSKPMYVKPEKKGGGNLPQVEHEGETYYFPDDAAVPSEEEGVPTVVHRKGESDPVNLRDGWELAVDAGTLSAYLTQMVTADKPKQSLLDGLGLAGMDSMDMLRYGLLILVGGFILLQVM